MTMMWMKVGTDVGQYVHIAVYGAPLRWKTEALNDDKLLVFGLAYCCL